MSVRGVEWLIELGRGVTVSNIRTSLWVRFVEKPELYPARVNKTTESVGVFVTQVCTVGAISGRAGTFNSRFPCFRVL